MSSDTSPPPQPAPATPAPILLFVYRRPRHTRKTLEALRRNHGAARHDLMVFSDAPAGEKDAADVTATRAVCRNIRGFRSVRVIGRDRHLGLAESVISGVTQGLEEFGRAIVLEDDLVTGSGFLAWMNAALETYRDDPRIFSVCGCALPGFRRLVPQDYPHEVWLSRRHLSHGWGTWKPAWDAVEWEIPDFERFRNDPAEQSRFDLGGADLSEALIRQQTLKQDLWAVRFTYAHFKHNAWSLIPMKSHVKNIGYDGTGRNCLPNPLRWFDRVEADSHFPPFPMDIQPDERLLDACRKVIRSRKRLEDLARFIRPA
ncbi:MAG: sugar transferase [Verrucomicrobia bacterium]|nr:sugar transferase [Verrucomicrobiota bacterium]MCH8514599.1 sugar transferase [Kiritimatiellia bacterium]